MKYLLATSLVLGLLVMAGCKRGSVIKDDRVLELEAGGPPKLLYIPAAKKVVIDFTSQDGVPVNALLVSKEDGEETERNGSLKGKKMAEQISTAAGQLKYSSTDAKVELAAVFSSNKKATVTVKITGE